MAAALSLRKLISHEAMLCTASMMCTQQEISGNAAEAALAIAAFKLRLEA